MPIKAPAKIAIAAFIFILIAIGISVFFAYKNSTSDMIELTGSLSQGPTMPVCDQATPCYQPVANQLVHVITSGGWPAGSTTTDSQGRYNIRLKPGRYSLQVTGRNLTNNQIELTLENNRLDIIIDTGLR